MRLILSRHGNTFEPGQPVVWTGCSNDLPLAEKGRQQAQKLAVVLQESGIKPAAVYCGPLQRTRVYGQIITEQLQLNLPGIIDERLNEIDYGAWTGLTNAEVNQRFGNDEQAAWDSRGQWPRRAGWAGSEEETIGQVQAFCRDLLSKHSETQDVLCITSNGRLRYFLTLIAGELERRKQSGEFKVKTGHICAFTHHRQAWKLQLWDRQPDSSELQAVFARPAGG